MMSVLDCDSHSVLNSYSYRPSLRRHLISLNSVITRVLAKPSLRPRREVSSLETSLQCGTAFCDVCTERNEEGNMVLCSLCRNIVHRECYGGLSMVKGKWAEWLCDQCLLCGVTEANSGVFTCVICGMTPGALKWIRKLGWAHPGCVLYHSRFDFTSDYHDCIKHMPECTTPHRCAYCSHLSPWTVLCGFKGCSMYFHTRCAQINGIRPLWQGDDLMILCRTHREEMAGEDPERRAARKHYRYCRQLSDCKFKPEKKPEKKAEKMVLSRTKPKKKSASMQAYHPPPARPVQKEETRCLSSPLSSVTGIVQPGTAKELEARLKAFFRLHKQRDDFNFYDVSHMPELVKVLGDGKVEHRLLPSLVLQHSVVLSQ